MRFHIYVNFVLRCQSFTFKGWREFLTVIFFSVVQYLNVWHTRQILLYKHVNTLCIRIYITNIRPIYGQTYKLVSSSEHCGFPKNGAAAAGAEIEISGGRFCRTFRWRTIDKIHDISGVTLISAFRQLAQMHPVKTKNYE